mgnify:CR=1 FL=1
MLTEKPKDFNEHRALGAELGITSPLDKDIDKNKDGNADEGKKRKFTKQQK